jgi:molybdate transport system regulatory protein
LQFSARNQLKGKVKRVVPGIVTALVEIDVGGNTISGVITRDSFEELNIREGDDLTAVVKATSVMFMK